MEGVHPLLNDITSNIAVGVNPNIDVLLGINQSMYYLGHPKSFTEMHMENGSLGSMNVLRGGSTKVWIIANRDSYLRLNKCLKVHLERISAYSNDACTVPFQHKDTIISLLWLEEHNINYDFVIQNSGNLLFIRTAVFHMLVIVLFCKRVTLFPHTITKAAFN